MKEQILVIITQIIIQIVTLIVSLFFLMKKKSIIIILLSGILLLSFLIECIGLYHIITRKPSFIFHYIYILINFSIVIYFYSKLISDKLWVKIIGGLMFFFFIAWIYVGFENEFLTYLFVFGSFNVAISILFYLRELLLSDKILNYKELLPFWVSVGFLVFYLPSIPFLTLLNYMKDRDLFFVLNILIILMNVFISYGLICSKEKRY